MNNRYQKNKSKENLLSQEKKRKKITQETNKQKIERNTYVREEKYLYMPSFSRKVNIY